MEEEVATENETDKQKEVCGWGGGAIGVRPPANLFPQRQQGELRNTIAVSYTSMRFEHYDQYLGAGVEYRFMYRPWIGVEVQASQFPETQLTYEPETGFEVGQIDSAVLAGHRWGKVSVLGEVGGGVFRSTVDGGYSNQGQSFDPTRNLPSFLIGGFVDVALSRRWSVTYEVRDNLTFIGAYTQQNIPYGYYPAFKLNIPEGRIGVAFHF